MPSYKHRQIGTLMIIGLGSGANMTLIILLQAAPGPAKIISSLIFALIVGCLLLFWSLTVEVASDHILVSFGFGIIRKKILLSDIQQVNIVRTPWYYGWGIRPAPHGWMFNVSGSGGVELIFENNKRFRIGTDQPHQLQAGILQQMGNGTDV